MPIFSIPTSSTAEQRANLVRNIAGVVSAWRKNGRGKLLPIYLLGADHL
jgi:hypothetical protein